eukprot:1197704-Rhodomonas_salina.1
MCASRIKHVYSDSCAGAAGGEDGGGGGGCRAHGDGGACVTGHARACVGWGMHGEVGMAA